MAELADARDLKSREIYFSYRFDPGFRHHNIAEWSSLVARRAHNPKVMRFKSHLRNQNEKQSLVDCFFILYSENHAIVAWFKRGSADEQKANKKQGQNIFVSKAPLCKGSCQRS